MKLLLITSALLAYLIVGVTHAVLMGETNHYYRSMVTIFWPLLYVICAGIIVSQGFHAGVDYLQARRAA